MHISLLTALCALSLAGNVYAQGSGAQNVLGAAAAVNPNVAPAAFCPPEGQGCDKEPKPPIDFKPPMLCPPSVQCPSKGREVVRITRKVPPKYVTETINITHVETEVVTKTSWSFVPTYTEGPGVGICLTVTEVEDLEPETITVTVKSTSTAYTATTTVANAISHILITTSQDVNCVRETMAPRKPAPAPAPVNPPSNPPEDPLDGQRPPPDQDSDVD